MKKVLSLVISMVLIMSLAACGSSPAATEEKAPADAAAQEEASAEVPAEGEGYELALITDLGTIDDKSFNQGSWEGLAQYAEEAGLTHKYYQPAEQSDDAYLNAIDLAVAGGAKIIVTPGFLFEAPIFIAQDRYPDVKFVLVDGVPHSADYAEYKTGENTVAVNYAEQEAGFLAGYAAVKDGSRKLGFMGGMAVPAVIRFGYGFVQGCDFAAQELGLEQGAVTVNYHYTGSFSATPEAQAMAASWYNDGIDTIFACGGAVGNSVMAAAEQAGGAVIGVDVDQSVESDTVVTSALKGLRASVYACVKAYKEGNFPGGQTQVFSAANDGVGLPMDTSKFESFTQADYDGIYAQLVAGSITISSDTDAASASALTTTCVSVTEIQ